MDGDKVLRSRDSVRPNCFKKKKPPGRNRTAITIYLFLETHLIFEIVLEIFDLDTHLLHRIALAYGHGAVFLGVEIVSHTERCADLILAAVALADITAVIVIAVVIFCEFTVDLLRRFGKLKAAESRS